MYKYYKKNGYDVMYYRFDYIYEFINYITTTPIKEEIFSKPDSIYGDYDFCKTQNFEEALNLLKFGYHKDFDKLTKLMIDLEKYIKLSRDRNKQFNDYVGYVPDVKAYLEGNPLSMFNKKNDIKKKIDVYMNISYSLSTSQNQIYNRGAIVLSLIELLESLGYNVDFHLFNMSERGRHIHYVEFLFKRENERLNPQKLYFPLCHPSFLRRLIFRLKEVTPDITYEWKYGYGSPSELKTIDKIIDLNDNDIIIPSIDELNIFGNNIVEDANTIFNFINSTSKKDFELEPIQRVRRL